MITKNNCITCDICGRFMSLSRSYYIWTPYGKSTDMEPPDPEYSHTKCYENLSDEQKDLIIKTSWIKPYKCNSNNINNNYIMTDEELTRCLKFLDYFNVNYNNDTIILTDGGNSCIMNINTQWKEFLGCSINSVAEAVAKKLHKKIII